MVLTLQLSTFQFFCSLNLHYLCGGCFFVQGGKASGFKNRQEQDKAESVARLYQVRGTNELNTKAVEVRTQIFAFTGHGEAPKPHHSRGPGKLRFVRNCPCPKAFTFARVEVFNPGSVNTVGNH